MNGKRLVQQLRLDGFLSYGVPGENIDLLPLNVLIGPNASGKSNLVEAFVVLKSTASDIGSALREGGGVAEYLWKGEHDLPTFSIEAILDGMDSDQWSPPPLRYELAIAPSSQRFEVVFELLELAERPRTEDQPFSEGQYYLYRTGQAWLRQQFPEEWGREGDLVRQLGEDDLSVEESVLSQRRDPDLLPELSLVGDVFRAIAVYRDWTFGTRAKARVPQPTDLPTDLLLPDASNLALVLHEMLQRSTTRKRLIEYLKRFYSAAQHISTRIQGGTVQLFIEEANDVLVPATRLSDGTLRYLSLLAILCHPTPPPIVCIEEPELGLHPDIMPTIAELLLDASQRTQLIVTTHSDALVSALSEVPECIVVCEPSEEGTQLRRLDKDALAEWLSRYSLGEIWRMGEIGGTRW